ncbi:MAG: hypothetical protein HC915_09795 [Anaerolineae bacterium]|nr:hypothetical protein [Anaerolineae bacterium]
MLETDVLNAIAPPRFVLRGLGGTFHKPGLDPQEAPLRAGQQPVGDAWGKDAPENYGTLRLNLEGMQVTSTLETLPGDYRHYYRLVAAAIRGEAPPPVTLPEVIQQLHILEAARQSTRENRVIEVYA